MILELGPFSDTIGAVKGNGYGYSCQVGALKILVQDKGIVLLGLSFGMNLLFHLFQGRVRS